MLPSLRFLFAVCVLATIANAQASRLDYPALLARLTEVDWLWQSPPVGERCVQWSSYDRASQQGPGDHGAWYANNDRGQHLRVEEGAGEKQFVMVDAKGPGCIARIWSANPSGTLHFDIDGARAWSVDFAALCAGKVDGVPEPIAGMRARGGNCYLPIPFQNSLVVSCTAGDCYYAFDVVQWAAGTATTSFAVAQLAAQRALIEQVGKQLATGEPSGGPRGRIAGRPFDGAEGLVRMELEAGFLVRRLQLRVGKDGGQDAAAVLRRTRLVVRCGDETVVDVPVTDFFAGGPDWRPWRGYWLGVDAEGHGWCGLPMPFPRGGRIELVTEGDPGRVRLSLQLSVEPIVEMPNDVLLCRASYHQQQAIPTRPFSDHLVLDAKGRGRFVGCSLLVRNPSRIWWGEGDEKFTVDGEAFPSWFGTGTEDYFGYAWCDPTPFQAPFHAQIECQGPSNYGFTQLHRSHGLDSVPFQQSFRFDLEVWHWVEQAKVDYATVAYWYGAPGATAGLPAVPLAAERDLPRLPGPPILIAENAFEGEALRVLACTGGEHLVQDLSFLENTFSRDAHRWWRHGKVGDRLVLAVPVAAAGTYKISAALTQADDFGIVQLTLGGQALGAPFDGYHERVRSSGARELGVVTLAAGDVELAFTLVGKHEKAKPSMMVGLDFLRLEKVQ